MESPEDSGANTAPSPESCLSEYVVSCTKVRCIGLQWNGLAACCWMVCKGFLTRKSEMFCALLGARPTRRAPNSRTVRAAKSSGSEVVGIAQRVQHVWMDSLATFQQSDCRRKMRVPHRPIFRSSAMKRGSVRSDCQRASILMKARRMSRTAYACSRRSSARSRRPSAFSIAARLVGGT